jgi:peptide/nickel transport system substrate-binding protein
MSRRRPTVVAFLAAALGACHAAREQPQRPAATLRVALRADVSGFYPNPPVTNESFTFEINRWIFDSLVALDPGLHLVPGLAERWLSVDERTYVFELRPGLRFSDGSPCRAGDVAASLAAALRRGWVTIDYLKAIESVRALDERRLEIRARRPDPALLTRLPWGFVLPESALAHDPLPVVGTGAFTLESWTPGRGFVLSRNPHYWGRPPGFERVEFRVVPDDVERMGLVERGEADVADNVPFEAFARLERREDLRLVVGSGHRVLFLAMRVDRPPFDDPRVREAVDLAIDRDAIVARVMFGRAEPAAQVVPPAVVGYVPELPGPKLDRPRARRLLAAAGHPRGLAVRLDGPNNRYVRDAVLLEELGRQLAEVGIRAEVKAVDKREFYETIEAGRSDLHLLGWASEAGDGADALDILFHPPTIGSSGRLNSMGLADPELMRLTAEVHGSADLRTRASWLRQAYARLAELRPVVPLVIQTEAVVHNRRLVWDVPTNRALRPLDLRPR